MSKIFNFVCKTWSICLLHSLRAILQSFEVATDITSTHTEISFVEQIKQWVFQGNPVLKVAILVLVIGIILLLRFATEHWQLSLSIKLAIVAAVSFAITALGVFLQPKNRSFSLAL